jgi:hypothetical protein
VRESKIACFEVISRYACCGTLQGLHLTSGAQQRGEARWHDRGNPLVHQTTDMRKPTLILRPAPANDVPPPPPTTTNAALIARIQKGDGEALWILHSRHADLLRDVITRCLPEEEDCEDVLREVFEDIRDGAIYYNGDYGRALGWMITLTRRRALQRASQITHRPSRPVRTREENVRPGETALTFSALRSWLRQAFRLENLRTTTQPVGH